MVGGYVLTDVTNRSDVVRSAYSSPAVVWHMPRNKASACTIENISKTQRNVHRDPAARLVNVYDYEAPICSHLFEAEKTHPRDAIYLSSQPAINEKVRMVLVDWLVDVCIKFKLHAETYFLAIDIVDRYLSVKRVCLSTFQLVGITAILLAAKHEERYPPELRECAYVCADAYTISQFVEMERDVAITLCFKLTVPTTYLFVCCFVDQKKYERLVCDAVFFFLEAASHSYEMLRHLPSRVAAASFFLGRFLTSWAHSTSNRDINDWILWNGEIGLGSFGISEEEVISVSDELISFTRSLVSPTSKLKAVRRKYSSRRYSSVGLLEIPPNPSAYFAMKCND
uniref:Uncharacterized protein TCIL3000_3_270 n=1 Tax=Trypanosoma congolense (strain IL3000) TaxID=1068625 RepID=G0UJR0_TRYCI|nr:unnamed protein product [Trypanosoma congolense IL3000]